MDWSESHRTLKVFGRESMQRCRNTQQHWNVENLIEQSKQGITIEQYTKSGIWNVGEMQKHSDHKDFEGIDKSKTRRLEKTL